MINSRQKGKRFERYFKNLLLPIFPHICRNANGQSQKGGTDFLECDPFDFEVKSGKKAIIAKVEDWLEQAQNQGSAANFKAVLVKPERKEPYVILPFNDFFNWLELSKNEGIIK